MASADGPGLSADSMSQDTAPDDFTTHTNADASGRRARQSKALSSGKVAISASSIHGDGACTEGDDTDDEEEEEPQLKYKRVISAGRETDLLYQDNASCLTVGDKFIAVGTHGGVISLHDLQGNQVQTWRAHSATINALCLDRHGEFIGSAADDGVITVSALLSTEKTSYQFMRPMKCIALHPEYRNQPSRPFVAGGMAGDLVLSERGWLGKKDTLLHSGEGPVFNVQWRHTFIAWACDSGVKVFDTKTQRRITHISRSQGSPRSDLYPCHLCWADDYTLFVGWADAVKVVVIKERSTQEQALGAPLLYAEITAMFQLDAAVCGLAPFDNHILILSYDVDTLQPDETFTDETLQHRPVAYPPSLRIVNYQAEELACDLLTVHGYELFQAHDYRLGMMPLVASGPDPASRHSNASDAEATQEEDRWFYVLSPRDVICARPRDWKDRAEWMVQRARYKEALAILQAEETHPTGPPLPSNLITTVGERYLEHLVDVEQDYIQAGRVCGMVLRNNAPLWEKWVFIFAQLNQLHAISPVVPTTAPRLSSTVYEMVLAFWLTQDVHQLLDIIRVWPADLYNVPSVIAAVEDRLQQLSSRDPSILDATTNSHQLAAPLPSEPTEARELMTILVILYTYQQQPEHIVEYSLQLHQPGMVDKIVEHRWIHEVRNKVVLLMQYDQHMYRQHPLPPSAQPTRRASNTSSVVPSGSQETRQLMELSQMPGVQLLVRYHDAIPPHRVVHQLQTHLYLLHTYLHALYVYDSQGRSYRTNPTAMGTLSILIASSEVSHVLLSAPFHDLQVELYAEYDYPLLLMFLRNASGYRLEHAYRVCESRDLVPEMVYLLGRMGDSHQALQLILYRLHNVPQAIEFAREQNDSDLWDELLTYAQDQPEFVTGLLEHAASYVDPVRVLKSMVPGLQVPGLKRAVIQILHDLQLQVSLRRGCEKILSADCIRFSDHLRRCQRLGIGVDAHAVCLVCQTAIFPAMGDERSPTPSSPSTPWAPLAKLGQPPHLPLLVFFCGHAFHDKCLIRPDILQRIHASSVTTTNRGASFKGSQTLASIVSHSGNPADALSLQEAHHPLAGSLLHLVEQTGGAALSRGGTGNEFVDVENRDARYMRAGLDKASRSATKLLYASSRPVATVRSRPRAASASNVDTKVTQLSLLRSLTDTAPCCPICAHDTNSGATDNPNAIAAPIMTAQSNTKPLMSLTGEV
ncbi:Vacuolar protein sorting-associated protein 41 [Dimargaris verticillata]|uniref:Vacuolar protein sorting-associated protein 41 n=1 Tax=Dimargaris verticillata TaxID=2761393 RepID=A0A9W8AYX4_9FUNG|nr:Vacuolar protein sorting-associated protein 41 [Dimargaris verticillata]